MNKKRLFRLKPECKGLPIKQFLSLAPKNYFYERDMTNNNNKDEKETIKKSKGISKNIIDDEITSKHYINVLDTGKNYTTKMTNIVSKEHQLKTISFDKIALTSYFDKAFVLEDGINMRPYGHKLNKNLC
jgi:hypothetical protein